MKGPKRIGDTLTHLLWYKVLGTIIIFLFQPNAESFGNTKQIQASKFLDRFEGYWVGEGEAGGKKIHDEMHYEWILDHRFLHMEINSLGDDTFRAEGYFWYNETQRRFEFYEFNNGQWPVRIMRGYLTRQKLILEDRTSDRHIRITLEWLENNILKLTEGYVKGQKVEPFVQEVFQRKASRGVSVS